MDNNIQPRQVLLRAFPGIPETEAEEMISLGQVLTFPSETILCTEGASESTFYIILKGKVRVTKRFNETEVRLLKVLGPGDFFGEMALIDNAPRAATVIATEEITALVIRKETFTTLFERSSIISLAIVREVTRRLRENDNIAIEDLRMKAIELANAYQQLAELEHARQEFLTTIAHELRTPLMAANGFMQMVRTGKLQGETLKLALEAISKHLQDITSLTNDILFLQEMDLILPEFQPVEIGQVIASVVEQNQARAEKSSTGIQLNIAPDLPYMQGDPKSLERAFHAILDNAIKFSPEKGEILLDVKAQAGQLVVSVRDHGVGIPAEALPRIFDRFYHLDKVGKYLFRGVGLGLSIARQVITQHHGRIEVVSELGKGSTFTITLPT